jgi:hypothetical protein
VHRLRGSAVRAPATAERAYSHIQSKIEFKYFALPLSSKSAAKLTLWLKHLTHGKNTARGSRSDLAVNAEEKQRTPSPPPGNLRFPQQPAAKITLKLGCYSVVFWSQTGELPREIYRHSEFSVSNREHCPLLTLLQ